VSICGCTFMPLEGWQRCYGITSDNGNHATSGGTPLAVGHGACTNTGMDITVQIKNEITRALEALDVHPHLIAIVGAWRSMLSDQEALKLLRDWNNGNYRWARITRVHGRAKRRLKIVR
jgi:hypothetical protein